MTLTLYPYQRAGVQFLRVGESVLLGDEMGLGKTVQTIRTLEADGLYPALIVCPNSVKAVWEDEFEKWAPERRVTVAEGGVKGAEEAAEEVSSGAADVLIINWESLRSVSRLAPFGSMRLETCSNCDPTSRRRPAQCQREDKVLNLIRWAAVVADEAHRAKDPKSQQTRALWAIGDRADRRYALTGTPIANSPEDLWSVMRFVAPHEYPAKWPWIERYAQTVPNLFSGGVDVVGLREDRREEFDKIFLPRFIRRTKAAVLPDLPPKVYERRSVYLTGKQKKAYDQMETEMVASVEGGKLIAENGLTSMMRLRQLASAYGEVTSTVDWHKLESMQDAQKVIDAVDEQVRLAEPSSKLDVLEEVLEELGDKQAVIFAESAQLIKLAFVRLSDVAKYEDVGLGLLIGETPMEDRRQMIKEFQEGELRYILATVGAGGEGITLTAADTAIFLQRPWSAVLNKQAEDRLHRIGQDAQCVTYIDLVTEDTVESKVFDALKRKEARLQDLTRDEA